MHLNSSIDPSHAGQPHDSPALPASRAGGLVRIWLAVLLWLAAGLSPARAECETNLATVLNLSNWTKVDYDLPTTPQGAAVWILSASNTVALQTSNADPSILLSPFALTNDQIQGSWLS